MCRRFRSTNTRNRKADALLGDIDRLDASCAIPAHGEVVAIIEIDIEVREDVPIVEIVMGLRDPLGR